MKPELPHRGDPGRCPLCGVELRPRDEDVFPAGWWHGYEEGTRRRTGGTVFGINCPKCGAVLDAHAGGRWEGTDAAHVVWSYSGRDRLVGGSRFGGRPGSWPPEDTRRIDARRRELSERHGSLPEAVLTLHLTTGLGMVPLVKSVQRVAGIEPAEAKRLVVRALAPDDER